MAPRAGTLRASKTRDFHCSIAVVVYSSIPQRFHLCWQNAKAPRVYTYTLLALLLPSFHVGGDGPGFFLNIGDTFFFTVEILFCRPRASGTAERASRNSWDPPIRIENHCYTLSPSRQLFTYSYTTAVIPQGQNTNA